MGLNIGIKELKTAKLGTTNISSIWLGSDKLWPTAPPAYKFQAINLNGETYNIECDGNSTLTVNQTKPSGYAYSTMTDAVIGDCVKTLANGLASNGVFSNLSSLSSVTMSDNLEEIGAYAFSYCTGLESITLSNKLKKIGYDAFSYASGLTSITIPNSVTTMDYNAFRGCSNLKSCTLSNSLTSLGRYTFYNCSGLTSIVVPDSVTSMSYSVFQNCVSLSSATIPSGITMLDERVFQNCSSLKSITIPSSVTSIGLYAFSSCGSLTSIIVEAVTPPTLGSGAFSSTHNCPIYVPCDSVDAYKSASGWSTYASRIQPISGTCLDCNWSQYYAYDAVPQSQIYAARIDMNVDMSNGYFIDFSDGGLGYLSIQRETNYNVWKVVTEQGETPIVFDANDKATIKFSDYGFETMVIDEMSLFDGLPFDIELCESSE